MSNYTYRLSWSSEDEQYVATCDEFPGLSYLASHEPDALRGVMDLVRKVIKDMQANGKPIP